MSRYNKGVTGRTGSSGVAKAGMITGITSLGIIGAGALNNGCNSGCNNGGLLGNILGGNNNCCYETKSEALLRQENATLRAERYADQVGLELYNEQVNSNKEIVTYVNGIADRINDKIDANNERAFVAIFDNQKAIAANDKQTALNKQASDYQFLLTRKDIDLEAERRICGDKEVKCFVESNYVPGELKLDIDSICPAVMPRYPDIDFVSIISSAVATAMK